MRATFSAAWVSRPHLVLAVEVGDLLSDGIELFSPSTSTSSVSINPPSHMQSFGEHPFTFRAVAKSLDEFVAFEVCVH